MQLVDFGAAFIVNFQKEHLYVDPSIHPQGHINRRLVMNHEGKNRSVVDYVQKWGHASSIALFDPACKIFSDPDVDGVIGYRLQSKCVIVFGDPVCAPSDTP